MFAWSVLKNLTSPEFSKQNLKNVTHGSKAKTKLKKKKILVSSRLISSGKGYRKINKQNHFVWTSGTEGKNPQKVTEHRGVPCVNGLGHGAGTEMMGVLWDPDELLGMK